MRRMRTLILGLALGMVALSRPLAAQDAAATQNVLTPGDSVRITVWRRPDLSGHFLSRSSRNYRTDACQPTAERTRRSPFPAT